MNWYQRIQEEERQQSNEYVVRAISEPGTISDWGKEKMIESGYYGETWKGQFGTRRYLKRNENGEIISAILIGSKDGKKWQELMFYTLPSERRQGYASILYRKALEDVGQINKAAEYSEDGRAFGLAMREDQAESE